jgi:hypothetical protein
VTRLLAAAVAAAACAAALGVTSARAADECKGLPVCLPVPGPWVAIPAPPTQGGISTTVWEMRCPLRGYTIAGIDARVSDRAIDVSIRGENGAPVGPGVTVGARVVFTAVYTGGERRATSFQPFVGCVPTSGGGARGETSVKRASAFPPTKPIDRRVTRKRLVSGGSTRVVGRCPAGSRLLAADHAYAFGSPTEPGATLLSAVRIRRTAAGRAVTALARVAASVPRGLPVEFQLHALCTRVTR